jgi:hypothetical protein
MMIELKEKQSRANTAKNAAVKKINHVAWESAS